MRTEFSQSQLQDPRIQRSNTALRACVHCGLCTATCPTYQILGDELDSPRGRIYLIKDMLEKNRPADAKTVKHIDRCLSCLACMTTCPSGVNYMHLVDHARAHIEKTYKRPLFERLLRAGLAFILPFPGRFRVVLKFARLIRPLARFFPDARIRAMFALVPTRISRPAIEVAKGGVIPALSPPKGGDKKRVALLTGCVQQTLNSAINDATIRLLTRLGYEVVIAKNQGCCGALVHHLGKEEKARMAARANIKAWREAHAQAKLDAILVNISGCGTVIKDYGTMLRDTPDGENAEWAARITRDISEFLAENGGLKLAENGRAENPQLLSGLRVAYHAPCSLAHGQKVTRAPKMLLKEAGFELVEPVDAHLCCGSAGVYNLLQPAISDKLKARKCANLSALAPDIIATGNIGCMTQIASGQDKPVLHIVELLDWASGGPKPPGLETSVRLPT